MEGTTPELGHVGFWSPKSSTFSGSDSIKVTVYTFNDIHDQLFKLHFQGM